MAQYIKQGNIFGRIGSGIGKGLAEQVPKEIERSRFVSGLQDLEKEGADLNPQQYFTRALQSYGLADRPQIVQSLGELAKQQSRGQALIQAQNAQNQPKPSPFPEGKPTSSPQPPSNTPSLTKEEPFAKAQEGNIPRTEEQKLADAGRKYNANPAIYGHDAQKAIDYEDKIDATNAEIAQAYQTKHENLSKIQDNVVRRLKEHSDRLGVQIPADVYSKIENKAIQATKPKSEGGGGLVEQQAMKDFGEELDDVSRDYKELDTIGSGWALTGDKERKKINSFKALEKKFHDRGDTRNFADQIVSRNEVSYPMAYSIAQPIWREPELAKDIKSIPSVKKTGLGKNYYNPYSKFKLESQFPKLAKLLGNNGSPLAVGYELEKKGYDAEPWYEYLNNNSENLKKFQVDQLGKTRNTFNLNDYWLSSWSGLEE